MANCVTNAAYINAAKAQATAIVRQATVDAAIKVALALWQRNASGSIANMQQEIAESNMKLAEAVQAHAEKFWPEEKELVDDIFAEAKVEAQYAGLSSAWGQMFDEALSASRGVWLDAMNDACLVPTRCDDARWQRNAQLNRADILSYAARQDETRADVLNERRYERQLQALNLGRGKVSQLVSYQALAGVQGARVAGAIDATINSALYAYGYYRSEIPSMPTTGWGQPARNTLVYMGAPNYPATTQAMPSTPVITTTPLPAVTSSNVFDKTTEMRDAASDAAEITRDMERYRKGDTYQITGEGY